MAQASRNKRKMRRLKRQNTLSMRMLDLAIQQRDQARAIANFLGQTLEDSGIKITPKVDGAPSVEAAPTTPGVEVTAEAPQSIEEADGQNP